MTPTTAQSLYRTWRSRTFDEVVGQGHITQTLRNAVRSNSVGHAYLLTGPRGTGKTSTARILARAVNCLQPHDGEPCNACRPCQDMLANRCLDLTEIDAASNNSVDNVRDLREKVNFAPSDVRRKVYIIDEVHMLSTSAFNALLKTLEEPPAHVLFLLATTDAHKVPATITSRCQRLDFRIISARDIVERLRYVCQQEGLQADTPALDVIAQQATGSLRDALSLLEQVRAYHDASIGLAEVEDALGLARRETLAQLTESIVGGDAGAALALIGDLAAAGTDMRQYAKQLVQYWRDLLLLRVGSASVAGRAQENGHELGDPALATLAARLSPADITAVLKAILQPDYSGRRSASAQWQLELAVVEASAHFASGETRPAQAGTPVAQAHAVRTHEAIGPAPAAQMRGQSDVSAPVRTSPAPTSALVMDERELPATQPSLAPVAQSTNGQSAAGGERASFATSAATTPGSIPERGEQRRRGMASSNDTRTTVEPERQPPVNGTDRRVVAATSSEPVDLNWSAESAPVASVASPQHASISQDLDARHVWAQVQQRLIEMGKGNINHFFKDSCTPVGVDGDQFVIAFNQRSSLQKTQVESSNRRPVIEQALREVLGRAVSLRCDTLRQQMSAAGAGEQAQERNVDPFVEETARRLRAIHMDRK